MIYKIIALLAGGLGRKQSAAATDGRHLTAINSIELSDALEPGRIQDRIHGTFEMVRDAVERELDGSADAAPAPRSRSPQGGNGGWNTGGKGGNPASNKQIKYLNDLAAGQGIGVRQLNVRLQDRYGVPSAYELSRMQDGPLELSADGGREGATACFSLRGVVPSRNRQANGQSVRDNAEALPPFGFDNLCPRV